jgi:predicted transcriptional regulator
MYRNLFPLHSAVDTKVFFSIVVECMGQLNLSDSEVAKTFDVSQPTVTRWRNGLNAPHPALRRLVYHYFEQCLRA